MRQTKRFICPIRRASTSAGLQIFPDDHPFQIQSVILIRPPRVLDQSNIPHTVQIARPSTTISRSEKHDFHIVSAPRALHRVQWLMNVADKMHQKLQRLSPLIKRCFLVRKHPLENFDSVHHAIMVIVIRLQMFFIEAVTIARL